MTDRFNIRVMPSETQLERDLLDLEQWFGAELGRIETERVKVTSEYQRKLHDINRDLAKIREVKALKELGIR